MNRQSKDELVRAELARDKRLTWLALMSALLSIGFILVLLSGMLDFGPGVIASVEPDVTVAQPTGR
jgi:hypothetical protein